ncbi:hypothetical protein [Luteolibacter flavescens]|uniref:hypothetical protein n=1 Tax=Luteolibacter flavescens TaxID=1859460 RepID=UPI0022235ED0|nr:hypothetical protein [Luteolibacter flavescens]
MQEVEEAIISVTDAAESMGTSTSGGTATLEANLNGAGEAAAGTTEAIVELGDAVNSLGTSTSGGTQTISANLRNAADAASRVERSARPAAGSISALTAEVNRLERELMNLPVGSQAFTDMAARVRAARQALADADQQARRLAGSVRTSGGGANSGAAVLEFSRAFEDAQYGIRGVLNNIPTLIAMLGGSAGLAGVISLVAVAGTQLWERLGNSKTAEEGIKAVEEAAERLAGKLKTLRERRKQVEEMNTADLARPLKEEDTAFRLQTEGIRANIQAMKDRIKAEVELDGAITQGSLGAVDADLRSGKLTADQAAEKRDAIMKAAREREIARANDLAKLDETAAIEAEKAAKRDLASAMFKSVAALDALDDLEQRQRMLKEEQRKRHELNEAQAALFQAQQAWNKLNVFGVEADSAVLGRLRETAEKERRLGEATGTGDQETRATLMIAALEKMFAASDRLSGLEATGGSPRGLDALESEGMKLVENIAKMKDSVVAAEQEITAKTSSLKLAEQASTLAQERGAAAQADRENQQLASDRVSAQQAVREAEQQAAERITKLLDDVLESLGDAASSPKVQGKADELKAILENGLQRGEEDQTRLLLQQLIGQMDAGDRKRGEMYQRMLTTMERSVNVISIMTGRLTDFEGRMTTVEGNIRNAYSR